ncbi:enoyl-CoA hydratase [Camelimonas abortus]|uniref:Enoyl-CoA hydratase n=1 Tax=Camelimonas abortus TaxID=1017184 RepID=A0ABV7LBZ0_9HYPH
MTDQIVTSVDDGVLTIRMNRPEKKNALNRAMYLTMTEALQEADRNPDVRVAIITGVADSFTAGNDLNDFLAAKPGEESGGSIFIRALPQFSKPLIAAVNGLAVGIGVTMLLHCDLVYASTQARLQTPFVSLGVVPEAASSLLLPRLVGHQRASELLLFGDFFSAGRAEQLGIVNEVVEPEKLEERAREAARRICAQPAAAVIATKALLRSRRTLTPLERFREEGEAFEACLHSPESRAAMQARLNRKSA